uniref:HIRAN domain-containing protein n=2 Tax=Sphingomonadaceae TaxID=41297 RepID=A0A0D4ZZ41_9SPHN|nr:hypothetical protein plasmid201_231 [Sphingomonas sp. NS2]
MLNPGDAISLLPEPANRLDSSAVAVFSFRGFQIGYLSAERCGWIGAKIQQGQDVRAIFQAPTNDGAIIRVHLDGGTPTLPPPPPESVLSVDALYAQQADLASGFWPDYLPPDD